MYRVFLFFEVRKFKSGIIIYIEFYIMYNFSKKRRYGIINFNFVDVLVGDFSSVF